MVIPPKEARYVVPRVQITPFIGSGQSVYLDAFDTRVVPFTATPSTRPVWQPPRNLVVKVKPTRLNYSEDPYFTAANSNPSPAMNLGGDGTGFTQWYATHPSSLSGITTPKVDPGYPYALVRPNANGQIYSQEKSPVEVVAGEEFTASFRYYSDTVLDDYYGIRVDFETEAGDTLSTVYSQVWAHDATDGQWITVGLATPVPDGATKALVYRLYSRGANAYPNSDLFVTGCLIEREATQVGEFFSGDFLGADYLWRQGGTPGASWSFYYQDREARNYILTRLLQENAPLGMKISDPVYADTSVSVVVQGTGGHGYGSGAYGDGPYGG
jgi:hypothetical protein